MHTADLAAATAALERWVAALHARGHGSRTAAAVALDARIDRFGWDGSRGTRVEVIEGLGPIVAWCARTPGNVRFAVGPPRAADGHWQARYTVTVGDFVNHGDWSFTLAPDGRIQWLAHRPDDLPDDWRDGVPDGKSLGPPAVHDAAVHDAADHDHDHDHG
ncbi:MAG: hypothetical protein H6742_10990 [Alphaproteobacteria bacterium]|nr:hypothetical protein [Alphaproteobacteria bacterium]